MKIQSVIENLKQLVYIQQAAKLNILSGTNALANLRETVIDALTDAVKSTETPHSPLKLDLSSPRDQLQVSFTAEQLPLMLKSELGPGIICHKIFNGFYNKGSKSLDTRKILDMIHALEKQGLPREAQHLFVLCIKLGVIGNHIINMHETGDPQIVRIIGKQDKAEHLMEYLAKKLDPESLMLFEDIDDIGLHKL